jgi:hypothetical protein
MSLRVECRCSYCNGIIAVIEAVSLRELRLSELYNELRTARVAHEAVCNGKKSTWPRSIRVSIN